MPEHSEVARTVAPPGVDRIGDESCRIASRREQFLGYERDQRGHQNKGVVTLLRLYRGFLFGRHVVR